VQSLCCSGDRDRRRQLRAGIWHDVIGELTDVARAKGDDDGLSLAVADRNPNSDYYYIGAVEPLALISARRRSAAQCEGDVAPSNIFAGRTTMRPAVLLAVMLLAAAATPVSAKGCLKGAVVGGVAGHYAGHHGVIGAAVGCLVGRHRAKKRAQSQQLSPQYDRPGRTYY